MNTAVTLETLSNWIVIASTALLLSVILLSWLASYRRPAATPSNSRDWFFALPAWAQIPAGLGACVLIAYLGYLLWLPLPVQSPPGVRWSLHFVGLAIFGAGWVLALWARWALGAMYGVSTTQVAPLQAQHRLIQHGPYAIVRHPMYLGYWLVLLGVTLIYRTWTPLLLLGMCLVSFYRRARREETALADAFGADWQAYAAKTRFLIPGVF